MDKKTGRAFPAAALLLFSLIPAAAAARESGRQYQPPSGHENFGVLDTKFQSGPDVTRACLMCHIDTAKQVQKTIHWKWVCPKSENQIMGKAHAVNNFCIALPSNEPRCTSCHAGYGWKDKNFDFTSESSVDCLVCHDTTGTYRKFPTGAGHPAYVERDFGGEKYLPPDLSKIALNVGKPSRANCGACHFYGGGGDRVKHGDLGSVLLNPARSLDVHMGGDGAGYHCIDCHTAKNHDIPGRCYTVPTAARKDFALPKDEGTRITCEACHGREPHIPDKLNQHTDKVACQTCHIPTFAPSESTKLYWDWSQAGRFNPDGSLIVEKDAGGDVIYDTRKGAFVWGKDLVPTYAWFNGAMAYTTVLDRLDPSGVVEINSPLGSAGDPDARIFPFKVHAGKQPYDSANRTFVIPKLFGPKGSGAYWSDYDWQKSIRAGMEYAGLPYSGDMDFVETRMYFPITHLVVPKERALGCGDCHGRDGRLAGLSGFYLPGRDRSRPLDWIGWFSVLAAAAGVILHGSLRAVFGSLRRRRRKSEGESE